MIYRIIRTTPGNCEAVVSPLMILCIRTGLTTVSTALTKLFYTEFLRMTIARFAGTLALADWLRLANNSLTHVNDFAFACWIGFGFANHFAFAGGFCLAEGYAFAGGFRLANHFAFASWFRLTNGPAFADRLNLGNDFTLADMLGRIHCFAFAGVSAFSDKFRQIAITITNII